MPKMDFYYVKSEYIEFLKEFELSHRGFVCVPNTKYSSRNKFVYGAVLSVNGINYFTPVSSKIGKNKQYNLNIKTKDKKNSVKGSLRFQYMIPVPNFCLERLVIDDIEDSGRRALVAKELAFCRKNKDKINEYAERTYNAVTIDPDKKLLRNSCDFKLLEQAYIIYCKYKP